MIATLSSEKTGPIELGEVEIEAWGAVSGLGELLETLDRHDGRNISVVASTIDTDGDETELGWICPVADNFSGGVVEVAKSICKLPAAKYRITAWPLVRGEYRETVIASGEVPKHSPEQELKNLIGSIRKPAARDVGGALAGGAARVEVGK